jgi:invasion protein IalB
MTPHPHLRATLLAFAFAAVGVAGAHAQQQGQGQGQQQRPAQGAQQRPAQGGQQGQQQRPAQPEPVAPRQITGTTTGWVKICQKMENDREGCITSQEVRAENGAFLVSMAFQEIQGENRRQLIIVVPLGMALQAGLLVRVDQERALPAKFGTCLGNGCFAGIDVGADLLQQMRRGQNAFVTVRNAQGLALDLTLPLATLARTLDGPATDMRVVEEQQQRLQQELVRRAEEARQRLLDQGGQQGGQPPAQGGGQGQPPQAPRQ